jgi:flagellar secretion chaperone FliS
MTDARTLYRESAGRGASPLRLLAMLYEQMVQDLRRAIHAIDENHIEARTNAINHAIVILGHLQNKLNHTTGGELARQLEHFYNLMRKKLLQAQVDVSREILEQQIALLLGLHNAWTQAERAEAVGSTPVRQEAPPGGERAGWKR